MADLAWERMDALVAGQVLGDDAVLAGVLARNAGAGLPAIDVSPAQGRFLTLLARLAGARSILEVGALGGYSTICLARGLAQGGRLVTLEASAKHAEVARDNVRAAGFADQVEVRVGRAADLLAAVQGPIDLTFIDADKASTPLYLDWAVRLSRPGGVIICDNVVREGRVADPRRKDPDLDGVREALRRMGEDPRLDATVLQTVGVKGYDGLAIALVR